MSQRITFVLDAFRECVARDESEEYLTILLDCLTKICEAYLRRHPRTPALYESGVKYLEEPPGAEDWDDIPTTIAMEVTDCETLACWRAAELRTRGGIAAEAVFSREAQDNGTQLYHILVRYPDGTVEDPSRILGMR